MLLVPSLRKSAAIAAALLALSSSSHPQSADAAVMTEKGLAKMKARSDFMRAMSGVGGGAGGAAARRVRRRAAAGSNLRRKLAAKARPMPASMKAEFAAAGSDAAAPAPAFMSRDAHRAVSPPADARRRLDGQDDGEDDDYGFDVTQYSFKYAGCSAVATYSDEMAEDEEFGNVVMTKRFVVFRLCPTAYCSDDYPYGCGGGYGEYIVDMDDYLDIMAQFQEDRLERYCDYCEQCMNVDEQEDDGEEEEEDDEKEDDEEEENDQEEEDNEEEENDEEQDDGEDRRKKRRRLDDADGDDEGQDQEEDQGEEDGEDAEDDGEDQDDNGDGDDADADAAANQYCADYQSCYNYQYACGDEDDGGDGEEAVDYKDFFDCQEVDNDNGNNNGNAYFVGPHCSYDKKTITVGLYADEYCSEYVGNDVDIGNVLGFYVDGDALAEYYDEECVTCNAADLPYQEQDEDEDDGDGNNDGDDEAEVTELCEQLFEEAGKCHKYMQDVDEEAYGENQAENEGTVCGFIQNVVTGQYDELGYIYLSADDYSKDNRDNQYAQSHSEVSIGQIFGLLVSALACVVLVVWACFLHRKLTRRAPWRPRRAGGSGARAGKLSRNNSGILMGRSRSGGSYHGGAMT